MHELRIVGLTYDRGSALVSFTASLGRAGESTTITSFAHADGVPAKPEALERVVEQRVAALLARPSPSGKMT